MRNRNVSLTNQVADKIVELIMFSAEMNMSQGMDDVIADAVRRIHDSEDDKFYTAFERVAELDANETLNVRQRLQVRRCVERRLQDRLLGDPFMDLPGAS